MPHNRALCRKRTEDRITLTSTIAMNDGSYAMEKEVLSFAWVERGGGGGGEGIGGHIIWSKDNHCVKKDQVNCTLEKKVIIFDLLGAACSLLVPELMPFKVCCHIEKLQIVQVCVFTTNINKRNTIMMYTPPKTQIFPLKSCMHPLK